MSITLYTAPDCIRCKIVKAFLAERNIEYGTVDFKENAQEFNTFYRTNRKAIYRNPEGVEFPLFFDGETVKQGSGEIIAYLLSGHIMEACVTRSDLLHGQISGLYPSCCPDGQEENFVTLVDRLSRGGLNVVVQSDGRKPELLKIYRYGKHKAAYERRDIKLLSYRFFSRQKRFFAACRHKIEHVQRHSSDK